jgi:hypothetical protein
MPDNLWKAEIRKGTVDSSNTVWWTSTESCSDAGAGYYLTTNAWTCDDEEYITGEDWNQFGNYPKWFALGTQVKYVHYAPEATNGALDWIKANAIFEQSVHPKEGDSSYDEWIKAETERTRITFERCDDVALEGVDVYWRYAVSPAQYSGQDGNVVTWPNMSLMSCAGIVQPQGDNLNLGLPELDYAAANVPVGSNVMKVAQASGALTGAVVEVVVDVGNARWWPLVKDGVCHVGSSGSEGIPPYDYGYDLDYYAFQYGAMLTYLGGWLRYWDQHDIAVEVPQVVARWAFEYR